jgi:hypothetical protein
LVEIKWSIVEVRISSIRRPAMPDRSYQPETVHRARHFYLVKHNPNFCALLQNRDSLVAVVGFDHGIASVLDGVGNGPANEIFVIDDENGRPWGVKNIRVSAILTDR